MPTQPTHTTLATSNRAGFAPLRLTLRLSEPTQSTFQALRNRYTPPGRNRLPAHVPMLAALAGSGRRDILRMLGRVVGEPPQPRPAIWVQPPKACGDSVVFPLISPDLLDLRQRLQNALAPWLGGFQPESLTMLVHERASRDERSATLTRLAEHFVPWQTEGVALLLWRDLEDGWETLARFDLAPVD